MMKKQRLLLLAALLAPCFGVGKACADEWFLRAEVIHVGDGTTIADGVVHVRDGRVVAVGRDLAIPGGATVVERPGAEVTPGMIDANSKVEPENLLRPLAKSPSAVVRELFGFPGTPVQHFQPLMTRLSGKLAGRPLATEESNILPSVVQPE